MPGWHLTPEAVTIVTTGEEIMSTHKTEEDPKAPAASWETPALRRVGNVADIVQMGGGGKLSMLADDTGDAPRKPKGQEK